MFGQLPFFLRHGYKITKTMTEHYRVHRITVHPGSSQSSFATIEKLDEPRDLYTYNLGEDPFGDQGHSFTLYPEETLKYFIPYFTKQLTLVFSNISKTVKNGFKL